MNIKKGLFSLTAASALVAGTLAAGVGAASAATNLGEVRVSPATGNSNSLLSMTTLAGQACPAGASGIKIDMSGPGITDTINNGLQGFTDYANVQGPDSNISVPSVGSRFVDIFAAYSINNPAGDYTVRIACVGDDFFTETGEFTQVLTFTATGTPNVGTYVAQVSAEPTSTVLSQNAASSNFGDSVTFTADVAPDGVAGSVQFKDGAANLGAAQTVDAAGVASFTTSSLAVGSHSITAVFTSTDSGFNGSTSNAVTHDVNAVSSTMTLTSNGPTAQYAPASFTATVSPVAAGSVTFSEGPTTLGTVPVDGSGVAVFSSTSLSVGTHAVSAHFTPSGGGSSPADAGPIDHVVTAFAGVSLSQNIVVTVPAGALTIVLDDGADGQVDLGTAQINAEGDLLTASGAMDVVKVTDTRAGDPGWTASGIVTDFSNGTDTINGFNLGWTPTVVSSSANQVGLAAGSAVVAGTEGTASSTPADPAVGLESSRVLAVAQDDAGNGTARLGAALSLNIPTDVGAGTYNATLTLTVV